MNAPSRSNCSVEPGPDPYEGDASYPDAPMRKFSRSARAPVEIAINVAIDAAVITVIVAAIVLVNTPWLLRWRLRAEATPVRMFIRPASNGSGSRRRGRSG